MPRTDTRTQVRVLEMPFSFGAASRVSDTVTVEFTADCAENTVVEIRLR